MPDVLQTTFSNAFLWWKYFCIWIRILLIFTNFNVPRARDPIDTLALVKELNRHRNRRKVVFWTNHYSDVIMSAMASQITGVSIVCSTVYSGADQRKHQNSASLVFVRGIHRWPVDSPHNGPVTRQMFPFDDDTMEVMMSHITDAYICVTSHKRLKATIYHLCGFH